MKKELIKNLTETVEGLNNTEDRDQVVNVVANIMECIDAILDHEEIDYSEVLAIKMINAKKKVNR